MDFLPKSVPLLCIIDRIESNVSIDRCWAGCANRPATCTRRWTCRWASTRWAARPARRWPSPCWPPSTTSRPASARRARATGGPFWPRRSPWAWYFTLFSPLGLLSFGLLILRFWNSPTKRCSSCARWCVEKMSTSALLNWLISTLLRRQKRVRTCFVFSFEYLFNMLDRKLHVLWVFEKYIKKKVFVPWNFSLIKMFSYKIYMQNAISGFLMKILIFIDVFRNSLFRWPGFNDKFIYSWKWHYNNTLVLRLIVLQLFNLYDLYCRKIIIKIWKLS